MPTIGAVFSVPEPWGSRLQDYRRELGDRNADLIPTHVTLVPPTEVDDACAAAMREHLRLVADKHAEFRVHLRGTGTFRPVSPVVFVTLAEGIGECEQLAHDVRSGPLDAELAFPYHPHVTVAQMVADDKLDQAFDDLVDVDCVFHVGAFDLYVHDDEAGWELVESYALPARRGSSRR